MQPSQEHPDETTTSSPPMADPQQQINIVKSFNKTLKEFTDELSLTFPEYKSAIRHTYHTIDEENTHFLRWFERETKQYYLDIATKNEQIFLSCEDALVFLPEIDFVFIFKAKITTHTKDVIWKYLHTLLLLVAHYQMNTSNLGSTFEEWSKMLDTETLDEEKLKEMQAQAEQMLKLMENLTENLSKEDENEQEDSGEEEGEEHSSSTEEGNIEDDPFIKKITKSKIAKLAEELVEEMKEDNLGINLDGSGSIQDIFNLIGKNPQKLMNLVKKVGNKIQTKMAEGNFQENELVAEAQEIMSSMQNSHAFRKMFKKAKKNGMPDPTTLFSQLSKQMGMGDNLEDMMKQFGNISNLQNQMKNASTQERLRKKMDKKTSSAATSARATTTSSSSAETISMEELNARSEQMMNDLLKEEDEKKKKKKKSQK
jgi:hypothetical protein